METPPPRTRRDTDTEEVRDRGIPEECPGCANAEPQSRSHHHLSIAKFEGVDALRTHLRKQYVTLRDTDKKRPDLVDDIVTWTTDLMKLYGGLAHPDTGEPLTWGEARTYCASQQEAMAERALERAPAKYRWVPGKLAGNLGPWLHDVIAKHAPVAEREPGEDRLEDI